MSRADDTVDKILVFQCRHCKEVIGDSTYFIGAEDRALLLRALRNVRLGAEHPDGAEALCASCGSALGRLPKESSHDDEPLCFLVWTDSIVTHEVGVYTVKAAEARSMPDQLDLVGGAAQQNGASSESLALFQAHEPRLELVETTLEKVQQMLVLYNTRLAELEAFKASTLKQGVSGAGSSGKDRKRSRT